MMNSVASQIDAYLAGPAQLRQAVSGMTAEQLRARPVEGKWSCLEVVAHVTDSDIILADRMKRTIAEDRPLLISADETRYVANLIGNDRDLEEELALLEVTRRQMARILRHQPAEAFTRVGVHNVRGPVTLQEWLETTTRHLIHHVAFITDKRRALGLAPQG